MKRSFPASRPGTPALRGHLEPRKSLGQHFLHDRNIIRKIVAAVAPGPQDMILEIGPGEGALTRVLAGNVAGLVAVEIDHRAVEMLRAELGTSVTVLEGDVLALSLSGLARERGAGRAWRVVGNIPYNITSPILFAILDDRAAVQDATLMMQREVARRLVARPETKEYGILSVFCRIFADTELLFDVSQNAFRPVPAVRSSVVRVRPLRSPRVALENEAAFRHVVRFVFSQRRKMLRHTLAALAGLYRWTLPAEFALRERPEQLTPEALAHLVNRLVQAGMPPPAQSL